MIASSWFWMIKIGISFLGKKYSGFPRCPPRWISFFPFFFSLKKKWGDHGECYVTSGGGNNLSCLQKGKFWEIRRIVYNYCVWDCIYICEFTRVHEICTRYTILCVLMKCKQWSLVRFFGRSYFLIGCIYYLLCSIPLHAALDFNPCNWNRIFDFGFRLLFFYNKIVTLER